MLKARIVSRISRFRLLVSHPTIPNFWGLSLHLMVNPKPASRWSRGRSSTRCGGASVFGRSMAALTLHPFGVRLDTMLRGEMGGRTRSAKMRRERPWGCEPGKVNHSQL